MKSKNIDYTVQSPSRRSVCHDIATLLWATVRALDAIELKSTDLNHLYLYQISYVVIKKKT